MKVSDELAGALSYAGVIAFVPSCRWSAGSPG
jgi:hypothetical protein